jgi:iron complex transport system ATP-binding protein
MDAARIVELENVAIGYRQRGRQQRVVVRDISVSLNAGEFVCLLGPNGAGKSTLIRTIAGMQPPLTGSISLDGKSLPSYSARELAQRMSLVLTQRAAVGMMSAATLVSLGRHPFTDWSGRLGVHDAVFVRKAMAAVGIEELAQRPVCELSDGERQKVMIARALAQDPHVMILDEATAFLDLPRRVEFMHLLHSLAADCRRAILLSTHDLDLALRCADRLWLLPLGGPLQQGVPEDLVLNDAFASAFPDAEVRFDKESGAFRRHSADRGIIALHGEDIPAMWTYRALERAGYRIVPPGDAHICVEVRHELGAIVWNIRGVDSSRCHTVEALLAHLQLVVMKGTVNASGRLLWRSGTA